MSSHPPAPAIKCRLKLTRNIIISTALLSSPITLAEVMQPMEHMEHMHHHHHHQLASTEVKRSTASYSIPKMSLINQQGKTVSLAKLLDTDKPVLLNFIYTSCTAVCPAMSATFTKVQSELGKDAARVNMISISIDPENDTPQVLTHYAKRFHAQSQWTFLTGTLEHSINAQKAFNTYHGDKMNHAPLTLFHAGAKADWVRYDGFAKPADLVREVRLALSK